MALKNCSYFSVPQFPPCSSNSGLLFPRHPLKNLSWSSRILDTLSANTTCSQAQRLKLVLRALGFSPEETHFVCRCVDGKHTVVQDSKCADSLTLMHSFCHGRKTSITGPSFNKVSVSGCKKLRAHERSLQKQIHHPKSRVMNPSKSEKFTACTFMSLSGDRSFVSRLFHEMATRA